MPADRARRLFLLENSQKLSRAAPAAEAGRRPLPTAHIITAAALLAALAVVYLYSPEEDRPREQAVPLPAAASSSSAEASALSAATPPPASSSSAAAEVPPAAELARLAGEEAVSREASSSASHEASSSALPAPPPGGYQNIRPEAVPYTEDELEILSWRADYYTLQVLGVSQKAAAEAYMARQSNRAVLRLYQTLRKNKPWFVVVAGVYPSRAGG